jgi:hypothetical protein
MQILTGVVHDITGRNVHRMCTGTGGNDPDVCTPSGHYILRANRQTTAPAEKRHDQPVAA